MNNDNPYYDPDKQMSHGASDIPSVLPSYEELVNSGIRRTRGSREDVVAELSQSMGVDEKNFQLYQLYGMLSIIEGAGRPMVKFLNDKGICTSSCVVYNNHPPSIILRDPSNYDEKIGLHLIGERKAKYVSDQEDIDIEFEDEGSRNSFENSFPKKEDFERDHINLDPYSIKDIENFEGFIKAIKDGTLTLESLRSEDKYINRSNEQSFNLTDQYQYTLEKMGLSNTPDFSNDNNNSIGV